MIDSIKRVVIVGRDIDGWLAALAVQRAIAAQGTKVTMLELASLATEQDVITATPSLSQLNEMLGIDGAKLLRACNGVPMVAQRFANWARSASSFVHAYDMPTPADGDSSFVSYWVDATKHGLRVAFDEFSPGAAASKQGRVPLAEQYDPLLPRPSFGYQLDARSFAAAIKQLALKSGIEHRTGVVRDVRHSKDRIQTVIWDEGETFEADLFVDASGAEAAIINVLAGSEFEPWDWYPTNRLLSASAPPLRPLPAYAQVSAFRGGWLGIHPLQDRTAVVGAFASDVVDNAMLRNLATIAGIAISGDVVISPLRTGLRRQSWIGNCVAVGSAAAELEPLDSALLHFLHLGLGNMIAELTNTYATDVDREQYNRTMVGNAGNIRDFQLAHYRLNGRLDDTFWDRVRDQTGPDTLELKIGAFRSRGSILVGSDEPFSETNWASILIGHGVVPENSGPWLQHIPEQERIGTIQERLHRIAQLVQRMPTVSDFLDLPEQVSA